MIEEWGFNFHGLKITKNGEEKVYVRPFSRENPINLINPKLTFPFLSRKTDKYIIKIEPQYHTELFPDSINPKTPIKNENLQEFRWQIEELRISLFAQELKTPQPISSKRLKKLWETIQT